jgi:hypothetical protein
VGVRGLTAATFIGVSQFSCTTGPNAARDHFLSNPDRRAPDIFWAGGPHPAMNAQLVYAAQHRAHDVVNVQGGSGGHLSTEPTANNSGQVATVMQQKASDFFP